MKKYRYCYFTEVECVIIFNSIFKVLVDILGFSKKIKLEVATDHQFLNSLT